MVKFDRSFEIIKIQKKLVYLLEELREVDILEQDLVNIKIVMLYRNILEYIDINNNIMFNHNMSNLPYRIKSEGYHRATLLDLITINDSVIIDNNKYIITLLVKTIHLTEYYINSITYKKYSYEVLNSKILYQYIIHLVNIYEIIYKEAVCNNN